MSRSGEYCDSVENCKDDSQNTFKPDDDLARVALRKCEEAINDGNFEVAEAYHERSVALTAIGGGEK